MGWDGPHQPTLEQQRDAMRAIHGAFPDLDLIIDTGDAHHGNAPRSAWGDWQDVIAGGAGTLPFFYTTGNHELLWGDRNAEAHVAQLGSLSCRPYYSYDIKGIHFVSVPQLMKCDFVTRETLEWLALDLAVHRDRTTILLGHNELRGTTEFFDSVAYRQIANSCELQRLIDSNPQIVAWCHGHNHTYEIVRQRDVLYVSNGRIGGYNPPRRWVQEFGGRWLGHGHLGGILIEVRREQVQIRAWSATAGAFLSELDAKARGPIPGTAEHLSQTVHCRTSLDLTQAPAHSYGVGGVATQVATPVARHQVLDDTHGERALFVCSEIDPNLIENADFSAYTVRSGSFGPWLAACGIVGEYSPGPAGGLRGEESLEAPGVELLPSAKGHQLSFPSSGLRHSGYYACVPGASYALSLKWRTSDDPGALGVAIECHLDEGRGRHNRCVHRQTLESAMPGAGHVCWQFTLPSKVPLDATRFALPEDRLLLSILVDVPPRADALFLEQVRLERIDDATRTRRCAIELSGECLEPLPLDTGRIARLTLGSAQRACEHLRIDSSPSARTSWLIRETALRWQVRGATVEVLQDGRWELALRSDYSARREAIIVPLGHKPASWLHRLRGVQRARLSAAPDTADGLVIEVLALCADVAEFEFVGDALWKPTDASQALPQNRETTSSNTVIRVASVGVYTLRKAP